jgi:hypothetical protein
MMNSIIVRGKEQGARSKRIEKTYKKRIGEVALEQKD